MRTIGIRLAISAGLATAGLACPALAQLGPATRPAATRPAADPARVEPRAGAVLQEVARLLARHTSFAVNAEVDLALHGPAGERRAEATYRIALRRPNRLAILPQGGQAGTTIVCTGQNLYTYLPAMGKYTVVDAPPSLRQLERDNLATVGFGLGGLLAWLLAPQPYEALLEGAQQVQYEGTGTIDGREHHKIRLVRPAEADEPDAVLWIQAKQEPLVRRVVPDLPKYERLHAPREQADQITAEAVIVLRDWALDPDLPDDAFAFHPPPTARRVSSLAGPDETDPQPPHPLVGKPAPAFRIPLLDGGWLDLAAQKGRRVVILDFWATWCGPCRIGLPGLAALAAQYKDKDVAIYAVDVQEPAAKVRQFLTDQKLTLTVALDAAGQAARAYRVEGIPMTVVIGKDGTVRAVHSGYSPQLQQTLQRQIDALLAE